ncbi:MAG: IMS domain-containing protein [Cyanobacteria bacterium MAG IRC1_bin_28]|nr:IMS domain-containing protein [Cyanobacteria bacterium MAG IRC1_bin_28]
MKLPLDHFRLLGVKPVATRSEIERALIERLRNPPPEGYSLDTLDARAEILRASGAFLMDDQRCRAQKQQLEAPPHESGFSGIELEPGQEMAAPLLLLEAQENAQAFELALELLSRQEEEAAFHGHQQAELLLVAALAARRTSQQMWTKRLYDQSAQVLERAIQVLGRCASQARRKAILEDDLNKIAPFRILDLLSEESCTATERQRGLSSLKALIDRCGGLDANDDDQCSPVLFQDFFKQVRPLLTIDEQLELFEGYSSQKASTATFLLAYTRAAAGFQRRQPAHVDAALTAMEAVDAEGLEPEKACLLLLLGQPDAAQDMVRSCQDPRFCQWLASYQPTSDSLLGLCSFCSQWLEQQVLPCYRDVDPRVKVDLDAYFLDPEVQRYINDRDSPPAPHHGPAESRVHGEAKAKQTKDLDLFTPSKSATHEPRPQQTREQEPLPTPPANRRSAGSQSSGFSEVLPSPQCSDEFSSASMSAARGGTVVDSASSRPQRHRLGRPLPLAAKSVLVVGAAIVLLVLRPWSRLTTGRAPDSPQQTPSSPPDAAVSNNPPPALPPLARAPILFDRPRIQVAQEAETLDLVGVKTLLRAWLDVKSAVLDNSPGTQPRQETLAALTLLAAPGLVEDVLNQHQDLRERGEQLQVRSTLGNVSLLAQSPRQTSARVVVNYSESTRNTEGATTNSFGPTIIRNDYTFIRGQQGWQLLRFSPSPP